MKKSLIPTVFWLLMGVFVIILSTFFVPAIGDLFRGAFFLVFPFTFSLLGAILLFLTLKKKVKGKVRKFLILTGASSAGFFISILLHNIFYGLDIIAGHIAPLHLLMEILDVAFFIIATLVCPIGFLIGAIGSIITFIKK